MIHSKYMLALLLQVCLFMSKQVDSAETFDLDKEINRLRKELASVTSQRQSVREDATNDLKEHKTYQKRMDERFNTVRSENDSLSKLIQVYHQKSDSLSAVSTSVTATQKQYDLLQDNFRSRLISSCDKLLKQAEQLPPMSSKNITAPLSFLKSELIAKNIENVEGLQRIIQILKNYEELTGSIQIYQGVSSIPDLQGTVYRLRLGCLFEAAVQSNGNRYAVWNGIDSLGKDIWSVQNDPEGAAKLLSAINIREGKALPAFAEIPSFGTLRENN